tara:strand:- start:1712 stop:2011 length:300 start_codon:yes stop_codon:yes gene_type:complete
MGWFKNLVSYVTSYESKTVDEKKLLDKAKKDAEVVLEKFEEKVKPVKAVKPKRAKKKGKFVADDKSTPDVNEAWKGGKAPIKKPKAYTTKVTRIGKKKK